ncbi:MULTISPECIES: glycosyltransferase family 4 protein [Ramlibacter]|uniref:Glycosyltransferase family 4 protein n=1 Tax=Ramlibacter aquaticus TaxID=2780094 RepID=A0ABR9SH72_9BURK|nr:MULTISPECIES: glycosyltransferase family 4 protein [Ramlibacter]MBE7941708.1 glycosyltransferase family 4 protein [Ramlibacter aquaticus]
MQQTPLPSEPLAGRAQARTATGDFIYVACPWSAAGGGMYKVGDYLLQAQAGQPAANAAQLLPLETRGPGQAVQTLWMLPRALGRIAQGRLSGRLAGVHVNMAERLSLLRKGVVVCACRALGVPVVVHLHAQMKSFYRSLPSPLRAATRWMFSLADAVVVIGASARRFAIDELGVRPQRVDIVFNGVPGPASAPAARPRGEVMKALFVGRMTDLKGVSDLLRALAQPGLERSRLELVFAGSGELPRYQALARELGVQERVRFEGWCEQDRVIELLREADLLVLPSHDEVLPLVVLEALAWRVPVLCTPVGELAEVLSDGEDARFTPVGDPAALASALQWFLDHPQEAQALAQRGRALYERQFSVARFFTSIARVHQRHFRTCARLPAGAAPAAAARSAASAVPVVGTVTAAPAEAPASAAASATVIELPAATPPVQAPAADAALRKLP